MRPFPIACLFGFAFFGSASSSAQVPLDPNSQPAYDQQPGDLAAYPDTYADTDPSALSDVRGVLDPYGSWYDDASYGTVWIPSPDVVGADFVPYVSAGRWAYDNSDYVWMSDYSWGWLPFHYGRWVFIPNYGWAWVPGRSYAPAWVDWRVGTTGYDYVGWAPTPPAWGWFGGFAVSFGFSPWVPYYYVPSPFLFDHHVHHHVVHGHRFRDVERHSRAFTRV